MINIDNVTKILVDELSKLSKFNKNIKKQRKLIKLARGKYLDLIASQYYIFRKRKKILKFFTIKESDRKFRKRIKQIIINRVI